jgi:hypothetical protein
VSTKCTIFSGKNYHVYSEVLDGDYVYIDVKGAEWVESIGSRYHRETCREKGLAEPPPRMVLKIPTATAELMFESELVIGGELPAREMWKEKPC